MTANMRGKTQTTLLPLVYVLFLAEFARSAFLLSFLPLYAAERLGFSAAAAGLAVSVHYAADTAIKIAAGFFLDRFSPRALLHFSFISALAGIGLAFAGTQPWMLVAGAALLGIGISPLWLLCLSRVQEGQRGGQIGLIYAVWLAALGAGPVAINFTLEHGYGVSFWLLAGFLILGWALGAAWKPDERRHPRGNRRLSVNRQFGQLRRKLRSMKPLLPGMVLQMAAVGLLVPILPAFATGSLGLSLPEYSLVMIAGGACAVALLVPMGRLADRFGHMRFLVLGFAGMAGSMLLLLFASSGLPAALAVAVLLGLSCAAALPAWNALMARFVPEEQKGTGWGVLSSVEGIGIMIGPAIGGWIAEQYGATTTVVVSALLMAVLAVFYGLRPIELRSRAAGKAGDRM
ncbi:MFS transporter [Cohnella sp. REN36]|uniref:MFS transporter n=1 Tax=Cohnella sp. REN36 TaxID=2887347 RepID=UPI001D132FE4|nr:MFS transporter [Cohnella sp. REN36]MCC3372540.1 MFS transporter [Cohnella sp. REN36]